jgi:hypothetical protein
MSTRYPPPPTKFGPGSVQAKSAAAPGSRPGIPAPPTQFGAAAMQRQIPVGGVPLAMPPAAPRMAVAPPPVVWPGGSPKPASAQAKPAAAALGPIPVSRPPAGRNDGLARVSIAPPPFAWRGTALRPGAFQAKPAAVPSGAFSHGVGGNRLGPAAPCCGLPAHAAPRSAGVLQRMYSAPSFPVSSFAANIFTLYQDVQQSDLAGSSNSTGRQNYYTTDDAEKDTNKDRFVKAMSSVLSFLKINGQDVSFGVNGKAGTNLYFHDVGYENQGGDKDNFHAEDWCLESFRQEVQRSGLSLDNYLKANCPPTGNSGQNYNHVFSIKISYSSCLGCVVTIREFRNWLERELGPGKFVLRVKFLRPYKLPETAKNPSTESAQNFISSIGGLIDEGIFVRMQSEVSAKKLLSSTALTSIPDLQKIAVNHAGVKNILATGQYDWLTKTWGGQGANRKGGATTPPVTFLPPPYYCGEQTGKGSPCTRKVIKYGDKCWQHK